jgi:hypothetical protein
LAAEQRAREVAEAKRQAEATAAKKKAEEEAAATMQAEASAKPKFPSLVATRGR